LSKVARLIRIVLSVLLLTVICGGEVTSREEGESVTTQQVQNVFTKAINKGHEWFSGFVVWKDEAGQAIDQGLSEIREKAPADVASVIIAIVRFGPYAFLFFIGALLLSRSYRNASIEYTRHIGWNLLLFVGPIGVIIFCLWILEMYTSSADYGINRLSQEKGTLAVLLMIFVYFPLSLASLVAIPVAAFFAVIGFARFVFYLPGNILYVLLHWFVFPLVGFITRLVRVVVYTPAYLHYLFVPHPAEVALKKGLAEQMSDVDIAESVVDVLESLADESLADLPAEWKAKNRAKRMDALFMQLQSENQFIEELNRQIELKHHLEKAQDLEKRA
jgi:hypothetical protein